jgi:alkanesulfonate monooxygenase SsuD/methylene tetrahydromethanopterin reductase-like flavin-dependent oxidoreductase (luciferase family)
VEELQLYFSEGNKRASTRNPGEGLDIPIWILGSSTESAYLAAAKDCPLFCESFCSGTTSQCNKNI